MAGAIAAGSALTGGAAPQSAASLSGGSLALGHLANVHAAGSAEAEADSAAEAELSPEASAVAVPGPYSASPSPHASRSVARPSSDPSPGNTVSASPPTDGSPSPSSSPTASSAPPPSSSGNGPAMPTSVPSGFTRAFTSDFSTPAPLGSFSSVYGSQFGEYDGQTSTNGFTQYNSSKVLYVQNDSMYYDLHSENGTSYAAAPQAWGGKSFLYGQYGMSIRLDSSTGRGFKIAFLLWPSNGVWTNEVDFPEVDADFTVPVRAVSLTTTSSNGPHNFQGTYDTGTNLSDGNYHTFLLTWTPSSMTASIDGKVVENFPSSAIPSQPMRLSLQAEGWINNGPVPASTTDILQVPWVYINTYN